MTSSSTYVIASNRGPVAGRGAGGLVAALSPAARKDNALWFMTTTDSTSGLSDVDGLSTFHVSIDATTYRQYYDGFANSTLWYLHHGLFDLARRPYFDQRWRATWGAYQQVNESIAIAIAQQAPQGAIVLIQDFQLMLVGETLRELRPDLKSVHFHHTPFSDLETFHMLPRDVAHRLLQAMTSHDACGFHVQRWADNFIHCCEALIGEVPKTFVSPATSDIAELTAALESPEFKTRNDGLHEIIGDQKLIFRADRIELAKNILRGFLAYDDLLTRKPQWHERVCFVAYIYPSREGLTDYLAYRNEIEVLVERINNKWATANWQPIVLHMDDDFLRSLAGLANYDVLLVNSMRDGLNLVAKEGSIINQNNGVLVLSQETGAWDELQDAAIGINPFDILETSNAILQALEMDGEERQQRAALLKTAALRRSPIDWVNDQLRSVSS